MCATITPAAPAAMPVLNGASSTASSRSRGCGTTGRPRCESTSVSPWPGKCFSVASMPASCRPRANPATIAPARAGSSPNDRMLITGLRGLLLTSATGREVDVHAERARFGADHLAGLVRQLRIAGGAKRHRARELGRAGDAHLHAPLEVRRGQQRQRRDRLQAIEDRGELQRLAEDDRAVGVVEHHLRDRLGAAERDHAADLRLVNQLDERLVVVAVATEIGGLERREDHLPDHLLERQLLERRVDPRRARPCRAAGWRLSVSVTERMATHTRSARGMRIVAPDAPCTRAPCIAHTPIIEP